MIKVKQLKLRILAQFVVIITPLMLVLMYQAVSDRHRTAAIESAVVVRGLSHQVKESFESFLTHAADAVDMGTLGARAEADLRQSLDAVDALHGRDPQSAGVTNALHGLAEHISVAMPVAELLSLQPRIRAVRDAIVALDGSYERASNDTIQQSIESARRQAKIVAAATALTLLVAAWFVYGMIIGVTEPLNAAVDLADRIAAGDFSPAMGRQPRRDLGNLLASLQQMSRTLHQSKLQIEENQRQLEQRVIDRTAEVEARTRDLQRSVSELQVLNDVGQAVNSSLDLDTVLTTIIARAVQLAEADSGTFYQFDEKEGVFVPRANVGVRQEVVDALRDLRLGLHDNPVGLSALKRAPIQVTDVQLASQNERIGAIWADEGIHAAITVPLLREDRVTGAFVIRRRSAGPFQRSVVRLLQTLAAQSVLAIENARLFKEIQLKGEQLAEASKLKSQFLANMSHELRTPLNAIIGLTEMMQEDAQEQAREAVVEPLERVLRAAHHLLELINDILDLSKIEAGRMELHVETFGIRPLVDDIVATIRPVAAKSGNELLLQCPQDIGEMYADQTRIRQSLLNLLSNANKFTQNGRVTIDVSRTQEGDKEWITLAVTDTGIGMSADQMGRLFQDFMQADASTTRKYGGTGLGLAISKRFCEMMGGNIGVRSDLGQGSTFSIRLPAHVEAVQAVQPLPRMRAAGPSKSLDQSLILVVDDDVTVGELMTRHLEREGFHVRTARGGKEGLELARQLRPAAITLDIHMPDLDGWTVLAALKGDPELADIPVVMVTIEDDRSRGYALGATEYVTKPIDRERLVSLLHDISRPAARSVLLVDDDEIMRESVRRVLEAEHWEVATAANGKEALERLAGLDPDVIVLDLMMPVMDGFEFLHEMRAHADWRDIPVLVLTARDVTAEEQQRLNGHVDRVMRKSASELDQLLRELMKLLPQSIERGEQARVKGMLV
jgi:signal transduction histidine kinase/DNA-binding response OmpR family regulator